MRYFGYVPSVIGLMIFALSAVFYSKYDKLYMHLMRSISLIPYSVPFIDSQFMYDMKKCWLAGIDIYVSVPCDIVPGNRFAYSPLWPRLPFLPADRSFTYPVAIATDLAAIMSVALLPRAKDYREAAFVSLTLVSPSVVFALERNNIDVWFYLASCAVVLLAWRDGPGRFIGYGVIVFAGLLKYYPFCWLIMAVRERLSTLVLVVTASALAVSAFVWALLPEIERGLANLPVTPVLRRGISACDLPSAIGMLTDGSPDFGWLRAASLLAIVSFVGVAGVRRGLRPEFRALIAETPDRTLRWLVTGSVTISFCYFVAFNEAYRGIYLLLIVPSLLAIRREKAGAQFRDLFEYLPVVAVGLLWAPNLEDVVLTSFSLLVGSPAVGMTVYIALWAVEKLVWAWFVSVLVSVLVAWSMDMPATREVFATLRPPVWRRKAL